MLASSSATSGARPAVTVLCGGVGAARMLRALQLVVPASSITGIVNTADDITLHGLHVSPDLDTITYTLADAVNPETGWGLAGETWQAMDALGRYGGVTWFNLGDRDIGTHLHRTQRLGEGATLTQVTAEITSAWDLGLRLLPMTNDRVETRVTTDTGEIGFQEYFVRERHGVPISSVRFVGADSANATDQALEAIASADALVIAPSNPIVSIGPLLALPALRSAIIDRRDEVVAVSPIIGGEAVKGPAANMLRELGHEPNSLGVARLYRDAAATLVIDTVDSDLAPAIEAEGVAVRITDTLMSTPDVSANLARVTLGIS